MLRNLSCITLLSLSTACVAGYQDPGPTRTRPDAGTNTSTTTLPPGTGVVECNPVQNAGCSATNGEACVYAPADDSATCLELEERLEHEALCSPITTSCDRGLTCTALPQDHETTCYKVCDAETGTGCETISGMSPNYLCMNLIGRSFGVCVGVGVSCDPNEDACGPEDVCSLRSGEPVCLPVGSALPGESCEDTQCARGGICVKLTDRDEKECFLACDPAEGACAQGQVCTGVDGQNFGLCQTTTPACTPLDQSACPGQNCSLVGTNPSCVDAGSAAIGQPCDVDPCARGGVCARMLGEDSPKCYEPCDIDFPTCSNIGTGCSDIGLSFGVCI